MAASTPTKAGLAFLWERPWSRQAAPAAPINVVAQAYERRVLDDGSVVELNAEEVEALGNALKAVLA